MIMLYTTLTINNNEYKLRLSARASVDLERKLGKNPVLVFSGIDSNNLPSLNDLITILHASLQTYQHNISLDDCYVLYDEMVDEGKSYTDLVEIVVDCMQVSGLIPKAEEDNSKN